MGVGTSCVTGPPRVGGAAWKLVGNEVLGSCPAGTSFSRTVFLQFLGRNFPTPFHQYVAMNIISSRSIVVDTCEYLIRKCSHYMCYSLLHS